jgi:type IV pilus assembly protein PilY1
MLSLAAAFLATAQVSPAGTPSGRISTQDMSDFESYPAGVNGQTTKAVPPLVMLVMSRDEQLFNKAYPDYTDLNGDDVVDTTYQNAFDYNGYFDPAICYAYSTTTKQFAASKSATSHQCDGKTWSGNFLNWVAMSRLDIIRWVLYGGTRSTDTATKTVLERAEIPDDLHAWAKVYSGSDINKYTPFTSTRTFCNVSDGSTGKWATPSTTTSGIQSTPQIRVATGDWADWATTAKKQCQWNGAGEGDTNRPSSSSGATYVARVQVCQNSGTLPNENFCVATGTSLKPEGLLQKYSTQDVVNQKRFGLITGSWVQPRKGGQLRRNIGQLNFNRPGTACATGDEFSSADGTFCYKAKTATEGIVQTLDRLQVIGWNGDNYGTSGSTACDAPGGSAWGGRAYDIQDNPAKCPDFGNPLAGMYAEALRYIQGASGATNSESGALPTPTWQDPYGTGSDGKQRNPKCATCSIVVISSGLNSFDDANVPTVTGLNATTLTDALQTKENITGSYLLSTYYNSSSVSGAPSNGTLTTGGTKFSDMSQCTPATIGKLSDVTGICLGTPGQEGSYLLAGLSYGAWSTKIRTTGVSDDFKVKTFGISLSDNLPSFSIPVDEKKISLSPTCRADPASKTTYASCYIGSVALGARKSQSTGVTYGLVPTTKYPNVGSYYLVWEDSQYGSDHDQDATNIISWCVGDSCNADSLKVSGGKAICDPLIYNRTVGATPTGGVCNSDGTLKVTVGPNDVLVRNQWIGYSSGGMYIGYQLSGTSADGISEISNSGITFGCNMLSDPAAGKDSFACNAAPQVKKFTLGSAAAVSTLQTPLWYAAKYSGYSGTSPSVPDGTDPPNYFFARNAGDLKEQLDAVFRAIASTAANNFGNATTPSSSNDVKGNGLSYQVQYYQQRKGVQWTGSVQAFWSDVDGFQREGTLDGSNRQVLDDSADYVVTGPDTTAGVPPGTQAKYRCTVAPIPPAGETTFDPSSNAACTMVTDANPLKPVWDAGTLLDAFYDPNAASGTADADAIAHIPVQRTYSADAGASGNIGERYIFTYLTDTRNGAAGSGTIVDGTQTDFVWNSDWADPSDCPSTTVALSSTSGFWGCYDKTNKVRTGNYGLLNEKDPALAQKLVNWVRGAEYSDFRTRTNNLNTGRSTYRLGDIVGSSPVIVDTPAESFDLLYSDFSYASFRSAYRNRRQMVYVGANDGMLHAFNGGFYVPGQAASGTTDAIPPTVYRQLPSGLTSGNATAPQGNDWSLGQEVWAFVPENLLPHLRWLADKGYSHVFYVDGSPVVSDVQAFTSDSITGTSKTCLAGTPAAADIDSKGHVCGWGTVMVVPFRLGGGPITVDVVGDGKDSSIQHFESAYVLLDITDPEQPPTVLGEITTGTYTTSTPTFLVHRESDKKLHFLLTIGSGPADNGGPDKTVSAPDGSNLNVWVYDLKTIIAGNSTPAVALDTGPANSFAGDMVASDFDLNDSSEGVYFGVVTNPADPSTSKAFTGGLWKLDMNTAPALNPDETVNTDPKDTSDPSTWALKAVITGGQPVTVRPTVGLDAANRPMVYFGTGRSFTDDDDSGASAQGTQQQYVYGVSDNSLLLGLPAACQAMPTTSQLFNATAVAVDVNGTVSGLTGMDDVSTLTGLASALTAVSTADDATAGCYVYSGWRITLAAGDSTTSVMQPSERVVSSQTLFEGKLLTPTYIPANKASIDASGSSECNPIPVPGTSYLYGLNYSTGTADPSLAGSFGVSGGKVSKKVSLGSGKASSPVLHIGNGAVTAAFGIGGGTQLKKISALGASSNGEISWREPVEN